MDGDLVCRARSDLAGDRHGDHLAREAGEILEEGLAVLRAEHAGDEHERRVRAFALVGHGGGKHPAAIGVVAAVEPDLAILRRDLRQAAPVEPLQAARPFGPGDARLEGGGFELLEAGRAQGCDRRPGIDVLMPPEEFWARQIEETVLVLVDEASAFLVHGEILLADEDRRGADALGFGEQGLVGLDVILRRDDGRAAALEDAGLLTGDGLEAWCRDIPRGRGRWA